MQVWRQQNDAEESFEATGGRAKQTFVNGKDVVQFRPSPDIFIVLVPLLASHC